MRDALILFLHIQIEKATILESITRGSICLIYLPLIVLVMISDKWKKQRQETGTFMGNVCNWMTKFMQYRRGNLIKLKTFFT